GAVGGPRLRLGRAPVGGGLVYLEGVDGLLEPGNHCGTSSAWGGRRFRLLSSLAARLGTALRCQRAGEHRRNAAAPAGVAPGVPPYAPRQARRVVGRNRP